MEEGRRHKAVWDLCCEDYLEFKDNPVRYNQS